MRYIFANHDRSFQITRIREGISEFREAGKADPAHFRMHPVYDEMLCQLADHFLGYWKDSTALVGLGGYGRTEMSPYSDIDILFLRPEDAPEGIYRGIRNLLYLLWDARAELGHSVRTVEECKQEADKDLAVLTSLMDTRLVWGDPNIYRGLLRERGRLIRETDPLELYLKIEGEIRKSYERFGHTIYLLEPHLKEGPGSLRYIQLITWLVRLIFGCSSLDELPVAGICGEKAVREAKEGLEFLAETRARLHFLVERRDDRLKFDAQSTLAFQMGFEDTPERRGVEGFMRDYYRHASTIDFFGRRVLARARLFLRPKIATELKRLKLDESFYVGAGGINHYHPETFGDDPKEIIEAFRKIAETGCDLDIRLVDLIRTHLSAVDENLRLDPDANRMFLDIFRSNGAIARSVNAMMKIGFLERFIPEFAWIRFLPQHDIYHQYTVDLHTIAVLENMDSFGKKKGDPEDALLWTVFSKLERREALRLAGLFHDIAKGRGAGHEVRGEQIAGSVLRRLALPEEDIDEVCFLIRNHLAMTHLAFKKDLHDSALVSRFAENVMTKRHLDLLTLLTHADLRAVGPTAFSSWRRMLLEELYYRTLDIIEGEGLDGEDLAEWIKQIKGAVREIIPKGRRGPELEEFLEAAGSRYFLDFYPGVIAEHYVAMQNYLSDAGKTQLDESDAIAKKIDHRKPGYSAITLITRDRRGLFFRIAGSMSANRINILSAWTHSIGEIAVATFHVNDIPEGPLNDPERWDRFQSDFSKVLKGEADVDRLVAARRSRRPFGTASTPRFPLKVEVDNAASDRSTIIEVYAHDRPGLLYDITRQLTSLGLNIVITKITTEIDQAADIFYAQDEQGKKIIDFERLDQIKTGLHAHLAAMEEAYFADKKESAGKKQTEEITF
ncbi:MAG: [protein-PII] uridylyltransferase [Desulfomonile tiedjei]|uniref:Bifunctional uridylyltransferase/uridylyl-removing enzyme n=1 Tax=Desulfomonile tiedjei TaxID=2358 RepID=A0A9D6UZA2_9BACT|nr:[protein-PII] uridylyltransferase [Desulfomonile tiedjei]